MSDSPYIRDVTHGDFQAAVIEQSRETPVLVDFWAGWCGPCQMLMPVLQQVVESYAGEVRLAKVDTDAEQALAGEYGVRSLPTVKLFKDGVVVDEFMGVQPEPSIRALLERHITRESDRLRSEAAERLAAAETDAARALLERAAELDPAHTGVRMDLAGLLAGAGEFEAAEAMLAALPREAREGEEAKGLRGRIEFARIAQAAEDEAALRARVEEQPDDLEARYQLAARAIAAGRFEPAMEQLLEIMRRDRGFRDDAGREGLLATFNMLGDGDALSARYRRQMFNLMH
jgi:putative thioredoxin